MKRYTNKQEHRKIATRLKIRRKSVLPRLSVFRSNKYISAQIIDDKKGVTLAAATDKAAKITGTKVAEAAIKAGIKEVVFDRGAYQYHGRVRQLADAAREAGLKF